MKRPNGSGSVYKVKGKRRKPWRVRVTVFTDGLRTQKDLGYTATRKEGLELLAGYISNPYDIGLDKMTFKNVYDKWLEYMSNNISENRKKVYIRMMKKCESLHTKIFKNLRHTDFTEILDNLPYSNNLEIKNLFSMISRFAMENDIIVKDYSNFLEIRGKKKSTVIRKIFTDEEIKTLWENVDKVPCVDYILTMIYSGMRIGELLRLKRENIDFENNIIVRAGIKTKAGKNRVIPIHSKILPIIDKRYHAAKEGLELFPMNGKNYDSKYTMFTLSLKNVCDVLNLQDHTTHDCRHTFATLMSDVNANNTAIKNIMGHSNYKITESVYTHKNVAALKNEIEKIE